MTCGLLRGRRFADMSGGCAKTVAANATRAKLPSNVRWNPGFFIRPRQRPRGGILHNTSKRNRAKPPECVHHRRKKRLVTPSADSPQSVSGRPFEPHGPRRIFMNSKNPVKKIGASVAITFAFIVLTYLLLPNGRSIGAAPHTPQIFPTTKSLAASAKADQTRMRAALGKLPLSFEMNRGQFPAEVQFASRGA